jgi:hypothetical protein
VIHHLKQAKDVLDGVLHLGGEECTPLISQFGLIPMSADVGVLVQCSKHDHMCIKYPTSSLGGFCADVPTDIGLFDSPEAHLAQGTHRHLMACVLDNGQPGVKCSGPQACSNLSSNFIANNIGCGSCNGFGACKNISGENIIVFLPDFALVLKYFDFFEFKETSTIGEDSCNGGYACCYNNWGTLIKCLI